jgi:hypothetical protein
MANERATVTQGVYLAVESSPGDGTTPNRILNSFSIEPGVQVDMQRFRPTGQKLESIIVPGKEWVESSITGLAQYSELHYLLSGIFAKNQVTQPSGSPACTWEYVLSARQPDEIKTYSFVQGDDDIAHSFNYGLLTELGFNLSRDGIQIEGAMIAHELETGATVPHAPSAATEVPVLPTEVSVYLSDTFGSLGSSKLTRALMCNMKVGNRHNPVWVLDADENSFVAHVELAPEITWELTLEANDDGMGLLANMRTGDTLFIKTEAISGEDVPSTGTPFSWNVLAASKIDAIDKFSDEDGVYAIKYTLKAVYDAAQTLAVESTLINAATGF